MNPSELGWDLYRSFLAVMRERSLSGAARALSLTQPTLGRHIDALETAFGAPLFTRSQSGLLPTPVASALVPHAEAMASAARALARAASDEVEEERGTVRIAASEMIGAEVLPGVLTAFRERHPRTALELVISNRAEDLLRRDADVAVRMVKPTQSALLARRLGSLRLGVHAHPGYLKRHGEPRSLEELRQHPLIGFDRSAPLRQLPALPIPITREVFSFRCDNEVAGYRALRAGFGLGICQVALAKRDGLREVLPGALGFELGVWIVMHKDLKSNRRVRLMFDHLVRELTAYIASQG